MTVEFGYCSNTETKQKDNAIPLGHNLRIDRKTGPIKNNTFGPGLIVILLFGPLITIASLLLDRAGKMLQGL